MPAFEFQARDASGQLVRGAEEAASADAMAKLLLERRLIPVRIRERRESEDVLQQLRSRFSGKVRTDDLLLFTRQMQAISRSGMPLARGMRALRDSTASELVRTALSDIIQTLETGRPLAEAMQAHPRIFSPLYCSIVSIGEQSGQLDEAFGRLRSYLAFERDTTQQIKKALRYPSFVFAAIVIAVGVLMTLVVPTFASVFARFDAELPWATRALIGTSDFFVQQWPVLLALLGLAVVVVRLYLASPEGRCAWDRRKLGLPVVGSILHRAAVARFCRGFHATYAAGVPIVQGLRLIEGALDNAWMSQSVLEMRKAVEHGESLHAAAQASGMFTPLALQMFALGEETGELEPMMVEVAEFYEGEVAYEVENIGSAIEPILTLLIGVLVLILALAVFLPMWDLFGAATGRR